MLPHEEWMLKAQHDLKSAQLLNGATPPLRDTAIYHAQQCAEKALKGYLSFAGKPIEKVHNVRILAEKCTAIDSHFGSIFDAAVFLTPFDTLYRYPDDIIEPDSEDVNSAIQYAEQILHVVQKLTA